MGKGRYVKGRIDDINRFNTLDKIKNLFLSKKDKLNKIIDYYLRYNGDLSIDDDFLVSINGNVSILDSIRYKLPVKFKNVDGDFRCFNNNLKTLYGSPNSVNDFMISRNKLSSLQYAPTNIRGDFYFSTNLISSLDELKHINHIGGGIYCGHNNITSLSGSPYKINGSFFCSYNPLKSLNGGPTVVNGDFGCAGIDLKSLSGVPSTINGKFIITVYPTTPLLKILLIDGIHDFVFIEPKTQIDDTSLYPPPNSNSSISILTSIFNKYYGKKNSVLLAGMELLKAGYGSNAKL